MHNSDLTEIIIYMFYNHVLFNKLLNYFMICIVMVLAKHDVICGHKINIIIIMLILLRNIFLA